MPKILRDARPFRYFASCTQLAGLTAIGSRSNVWVGILDRRASAGIVVRYAHSPLHRGWAFSRMAAASPALPTDDAACASSSTSAARVADLTPSAPTRTSQVAVVPSWKCSVTGFWPHDRWLYEKRRLLVYVRADGERWRSRICWNSGRWTVTKPPAASER